MSKSQLIDLYLKSEGIKFKSDQEIFEELDPSKKRALRISAKINKTERDIKKRKKSGFNFFYYALGDRYYFPQKDLKKKYYQILLDLRLEGIICDLGCGMGLDAVLLALEDSKRFVIGIDISEIGVKYAKMRALRYKLQNIDFIVADMDNLPFRSESIDNYISSDAFSLYEMTRNRVRSTLRTLKGGGKLVIGESTGSVTESYSFYEKIMHLIEGTSSKIEDFYHFKWVRPSRGDRSYGMLIIKKIRERKFRYHL